MSNIAFVGAYERDNFGDYLLYSESNRYAVQQGLTGRITSPFRSDMTEDFGIQVEQYSDVFGEELLPSWVVGGEVGGTRLAAAQRTTGLPNANAQLPAYASPYLPLLRDEEGRPVPTVINSVGLAGLRTLRGAAMGYAVKAVADASYVSVREHRSSAVLKRLKVDHRVAPDVVHGISDSEHLPAAHGHGAAVIHMKAAWIQKYGSEEIAAQIAASSYLRRTPIVFFVAGTAPGHDSVDEINAVIVALSKQHGISATIAEPMSPYEKAAFIGGAAAWIGTSLHGLIISTSLDVPAVALQLPKLSAYARAWGLPAPTGVTFDGIDDALTYVHSARMNEARKRVGPELARLARESASEAAGRLSESLESWGEAKGGWRMPAVPQLWGYSVSALGRLVR